MPVLHYKVPHSILVTRYPHRFGLVCPFVQRLSYDEELRSRKHAAQQRMDETCQEQKAKTQATVSRKIPLIVLNSVMVEKTNLPLQKWEVQI